jgi:hypothetical protein
MNPPKGIFETEVDEIEWELRSQLSAKWNTAVAANVNGIRDGL